jgi:amino acid adenylation domain-containing protein
MMSGLEHPLPAHGIAVVGIAGRFPGADSVDEYWRNLVAGAESVSVFTTEELAASGISQADLQNPDYVRARGLLKDPDLFDAAFFGISNREAELMDPQHRLFLETCWNALEHAAIVPLTFPGLIGVWGGASTGMTNSRYLLNNLHARPGILAVEDVLPALLGNENDYLTTRVSYKLNLRGPSVNVQTACSTSLVAVVQACQALLTWQCDAALAGGVSVSYPQKEGYVYVEGGIGSPDGHCRPFDADAQGTVFSNGVGVVVLRRLEDALADRHTIYAVIRGAALNNDGSTKVSFAAPSVDGQAEVIAMAQSAADVLPETIDYIEAHGTATPLGDPIEVAALTKAFRAGGATDNGFCALGSVKSNFGHVDGAAGVAGLIKTTFALHHRQMPPTLHFRTPNPKCDLANSPFFVNAELRNWPRNGHPRRAGVSSFGIGGTNAHVVLEEAPVAQARETGDQVSTLLVLSARTPTALSAAAANLSSYLAGNPDVPLADVAHTLQVGRQAFAHRRAIVCSNREGAIRALGPMADRTSIAGVPEFGSRAIAFMFSGGGTQHVNMGRDLLGFAPVYRDELDRCFEIIRPTHDIRAALFPDVAHTDAAAALLEQPSWGLPALFAVQYALARQWMAWGVRPDALIGHSMGEYTAACLAGVMSLEDALALVMLRGRLFETLPPGEMLGVPLPESAVRPFLGDALAIAAINAPSSCVVSGPPDALAVFTRVMADDGVECRRLHIAVAAHSPMVDPILGEFERFSKSITLSAPTIPIVSNATGSVLGAEEARSSRYWSHHLRGTVRFFDGVSTLLAEPNRVLLEVGPGQTLCGFARQHPSNAAGQVVQASMRQAKEQTSDVIALQQAVGRLWVSGVPVDWSAYSAAQGCLRIALPSYPFEPRRHLIEPSSGLPRTDIQHTAVAPPTVTVLPHMSEVKPVVTNLSVAPARSRAERICERLVELLHKLSGLAIADIDPKASFLEMGFDSLFLTQASLRFKSEFKVRITFRQLFEDAPTLEALTSYIDSQLPPDAFPAPAVQAPVPAAPPTIPKPSVPAAPAHPSTARPPASALEQVIQQQLQLMAEQLRLLGGASADISVVQALLAAQPAQTSAVTPEPAETRASGPVPSMSPKADAKPHPAFKPIDRNADALSPEQHVALDRWTKRYTRRTAGSKKLASQYRSVLADPRCVMGFNRAWKEMVYQIVTTKSEGAKIWDIDGNEYVDTVGGYGSLLFGHRAPLVVDAVQDQLRHGFEIGPLPLLAGEVAALVSELTGMQRVGFANTGSEAVLAATRLARTVTGRDKIAVFEGSYHGLFDEVLSRPLVSNGEVRTAPAAPGIPGSAVSQVILLDYGNPESLEIIRARESEIAAILVEPVQSRRLDLQPREFLQDLRRLADEIGSALIFDEVITGFRVHPGGAQAHFGVRADLASYGKVIGGGLPIGIVAGDAKFMDAFDGGQWQYGDTSFPEVGVTYFAGTFVRHPLALSAAKAVLNHLKAEGPSLQQRLGDRIVRLAEDCRALIVKHKAPYKVTQFSSMMTLSFPYEQKYAVMLFYLMRERGIHIWEGRPAFFGTAHSEADYAAFLTAFDDSLAEMRAAHFFGEVPADEHPSALVASGSDDVIPFTEGQQEIWLGGQMGEAASRAYNEVVALDLRGTVDLAAMQRAVDQLVARHESLRMTVSTEPLGLRLNARMELPIAVKDVQALLADEREAALQQALRAGDGEPFDLAAGPLLRLTLLTFSAEHHVLIMVAHHLVCDGWSFGIALRDLAALYSAAAQQRIADLPAPLQGRDFARDDHEQKRSSEAAEAEAFWLQQFQTVPDPLELPADRPRLPVKSYRGSRFSVQFDGPLARNLKKLAAQHRTTLFTTLLAVYETLVHRLTGQNDFVVGIPVAWQPMLGDADLVAHCINFVPMRARIEPTATFAQYLDASRRRALDISEHQNFTYGSLLSKLRLPHKSDRDPLVSISFTLEPAIEGLQFHGIASRSLTVPRTTSKRDLHVNVMEMDGGLLVEADYSTDLYDEATVRRWIDNYRVLLEAAVTDPQCRLSDLRILTTDEERKLLVDWNNTRADVPVDRLIHQIVEDRAARMPEATAVVCDERQLSWSDLNRRANQLARLLVARGVTPGSLIALCLERSDDFVVSVLAAHKAGAGYVPLDPGNPRERLAFLVNDAGVRLVITHAASADRISESSAPVLNIDIESGAIDGQLGDDLNLAIPTTSVAYVIYTSGSTGQPKGVVVEHRQLLNHTGAILDRLGLGVGTSYAFVSAIAADGAVTVTSALAAGWVVHAIRPAIATDARALADYFTKHGIDFLKIVPSYLASLLRDHPTPALMPRRCLMLGGEASSPLWVGDLRRLAPDCAIVNHYGPTETTVGVLTYWMTGDPIDAPRQRFPIGRPLANVRAYVLDAQGAPAPIGVTGELCIGGASITRGYLNRPELTAERFVPDRFSNEPGARLYRTGDRARVLADGNVDFLGRVDHQVKVRGFRVELGEIEAAMRAENGVTDAVVLLREDVPGDPHLVGYVTTASPESFATADLRAHLKQMLPDYLVPSAVVALSAWPLTPIGKLDRRALPAPEGRHGAEAAFVAPATPTEQRLGEIWSDVLGKSSGIIGANDDFFDLGGHSLLAARAAMRVRDAFGVDVSLAMFFETPTIATMSAAIDAAGTSRSSGVISRSARVRGRKDELVRP